MKRLAIVCLSLTYLMLVGSKEKAPKKIELSQSAAAPQPVCKSWAEIEAEIKEKEEKERGKNKKAGRGPTHAQQEAAAQAARDRAEEIEKQKALSKAWAGGDAYYETGVSAAAESGAAKPSTKKPAKKTVASEWTGAY